MQLLPQASSFSPSERCADAMLITLPPVMRFVRKHMRSRRNKGLSVPQFRSLALLRSAPEANLSAVADFLGTSLPTASRIVSGLVEKGYVARRSCTKDRRQLKLALTSKGSVVMEASCAVTREHLARELGELSEADVRTISRAMLLLHEVFAPGLSAADVASQPEKRVRGKALV